MNRNANLMPEKKWYSTYNERPQGEWDKVAELMMVKFGRKAETHFSDATSPLSRGTLKSKGDGKLSFHFCADGDEIETVFRTIISVNQLSIYGAVSDSCEEYSTCHTSTGKPALAEQSDTLFAPANLLIMTPRPSIEIPVQEICIAEIQGKSGQASTTRSIDQNFVLMQDSWKQLKSDNTSWQSTLTSADNLQSQWHVVSVLYQEMKNQLTRKVGFEGTPKLNPVLEVTTSYLQSKYGVEIRIESVNKDNSHSWVRMSHGLNKLVTDLIDKEVRRQRAGDLYNEDGSICVCKPIKS